MVWFYCSIYKPNHLDDYSSHAFGNGNRGPFNLFIPIKRIEVVKGLKGVLIGCMVLLLIQVVLGTEVRAVIDRISMSGIDRNSWIGMLGSEFITHRTFSWIVLIAHVILMVQMMKTKGNKALPRALFILILCTLLTGAGMAYFNIPAFLQPVHLLIATMTFGLQLVMLFRLADDKKVVSQ